MKHMMIMMMVALLVLSNTCYALPYDEEYGEFFPLLTVVTDTWQEGQDYVVECTDKTGNQWYFFSEDDSWQPGDIANLLMWNNGATIYESEIIEVYWEGYTEDFTQFIKTLTW